MAEKLDPNALAEIDDDHTNDRKGVQLINEQMIIDHVIEKGFLPMASAIPFAGWLDMNWFDFSEEPGSTNEDIVQGALAYWRGEA